MIYFYLALFLQFYLRVYSSLCIFCSIRIVMDIWTQDPVLNLLWEIHIILQVWHFYFQNHEKEQISHPFPLQYSSRHVRSLESDWRKYNMRHQDSWLGKTCDWTWLCWCVRTAAAAIESKLKSHCRVFVSLTGLDCTRLDSVGVYTP